MSAVTVGAAGAAGTFDYTGDGVYDHYYINLATAAAGVGGTVALSTGVFYITDNFSLPVGVSLVGTAGTILRAMGAREWTLSALGTNAISGLEFEGGFVLSVRGSDVAVSGCTSRQALYGVAAFEINVVAGLVENVTFDDCHADHTSGFGFMHSDTAVGDLIRNVAYTNCTAIGCGARNDLITPAGKAEWVTGFDFAEGASTWGIENVTVENCRADGCWESGFHCEWAPTSTNCRIANCTSAGNGVKPSAVFGCGFLFPPGWTIEDCVSTGDYQGMQISTAAVTPASDTPVRVARCRIVDPLTHGVQIWGQSAAPLTDVVFDRVTFGGVLSPYTVIWLNGVAGGVFTDIELTGGTSTFPVYNHDHASTWTIAYYLEQFRASIAAPVTGEAVSFTDQSDNDGLTAWTWDFGDGSGSSAQHPTHAYAAPGRYVVSLTAGGTSVSMTVTVGCEPRTPGYYKQRAPNMHRMVNNARKLV